MDKKDIFFTCFSFACLFFLFFLVSSVKSCTLQQKRIEQNIYECRTELYNAKLKLEKLQGNK